MYWCRTESKTCQDWPYFGIYLQMFDKKSLLKAANLAIPARFMKLFKFCIVEYWQFSVTVFLTI